MEDIDEFARLVSNWGDLGRRSINDWYEEYRKLYMSQPGKQIDYEPVKDIQLTAGFRDKNKYKFADEKRVLTMKSPESFPLKENIKRYQCHKVGPRGMYLIDLMFSGKFTYLVAINVNTRYTYAAITNVSRDGTGVIKSNTKTTTAYLRALQSIISSDKNPPKIQYLRSDDEAAFKSALARSFYRDHGISHETVPREKLCVYPSFMKEASKKVKSEPLHSSLGLIDRVIRTIRDMAYNMEVETITPDVMAEILKQYNHAPHKTLTKYAGFDVSPYMAQTNPDLEEFIVRRISAENYRIQSQPSFKLKPGTKVKVYNENSAMMKRRSKIQPGEYYVEEFKDGLWTVRDEKNSRQRIPRYKLSPAS